MKFLIEPEIFEDDIENLISCLKEKKIVHHFIKQDSIPVYLNDKTWHQKAFCYGSLEFIRKIKELKNHNLLTSCTIENYDWRVYYQKYRGFPNNLFNWGFTLVKCRDLKENFFYSPNVNTRLFIRPTVGYKPNGFNGGIYTEKDLDYINSCFGKNDELVVAPIKHIDFEYRLIFNKDKCVTGCQYKTFCEETNKLGTDFSEIIPSSVIYLAERIVENSHWYPDDLYVVDIAKNKEGTFLLELNALSTSGWYDCDYSKIVDEIRRIYD